MPLCTLRENTLLANWIEIGVTITVPEGSPNGVSALLAHAARDGDAVGQSGIR